LIVHRGSASFSQDLGVGFGVDVHFFRMFNKPQEGFNMAIRAVHDSSALFGRTEAGKSQEGLYKGKIYKTGDGATTGFFASLWEKITAFFASIFGSAAQKPAAAPTRKEMLKAVDKLLEKGVDKKIDNLNKLITAIQVENKADIKSYEKKREKYNPVMDERFNKFSEPLKGAFSQKREIVKDLEATKEIQAALTLLRGDLLKKPKLKESEKAEEKARKKELKEQKKLNKANQYGK
jgi:hypothetical protein